MKLAVIGSRTFNDYELLKKHLDDIHIQTPITLIVSGGAKGADTFGEKWANENNIETLIIKPDWNKYGKCAGFARNKDIVLNSEQVVVFWDNISTGTLHSINVAEVHNIPCKVINFKN